MQTRSRALHVRGSSSSCGYREALTLASCFSFCSRFLLDCDCPRWCVTSTTYDSRQYLTATQLIFSVFKTLTDQRVTVELKNDLSITGTLKSVDQYVCTLSLHPLRAPYTSPRFLNIRLDNIKVLDEARHPHMVRQPFRATRAWHVCTDTHPPSDGSQELLHPGLCRSVRATPC